MIIVVCVKHVPDPNFPLEMDGQRLKRAGVLEPRDESASRPRSGGSGISWQPRGDLVDPAAASP